MVADDGMSLLLGILLAAGAVALARLGFRRERWHCAQSCRFQCPRFHSDADCELVQDVRTGQWKDVRTCSLFPAEGEVPCDWDCVRRLNLGFRLQGWQQAFGGTWSVR